MKSPTLALTALTVLLTTASATPIAPRAPLCVPSSPFVDNSTSTSPLVADCLEILKVRPEAGIFTYDAFADPRWLHIWTYRSCMFGIRAKTVDTKFNTDDEISLAWSILERKVATDHIEGTGVVNCGVGEVEWAFYTPRNSDWA